MTSKRYVRLLQVLFIFHVLCCFKCGDDYTDAEIKQPAITIKMNNTVYHPQETIWIDAWVSTSNFDTTERDSIAATDDHPFYFSIHQLKTGQTYNVNYGFNHADVVSSLTPFSDAYSCFYYINTVKGVKDANGKNLFRYRIGITPKETGVFLINFPEHVKFENVDRKQNLLSVFTVAGNNTMVWENCNGNVMKRNVENGDVFVEVQ
ncbi:hypothetical protein ASG01_12565 [Chryseobacterium sp. Leaf180]|nr:hypothetical protein ASG01_12565 [Chryseobacterium sp. Leaf180]